jgi:hypothetical protein
MRQATKRQTELTIRFPKPHVKQAEIAASKAKRVVVNAGRRAGKTTLAARISIKKMILEKRRVLLSSTTQNQADAFWEKSKLWLGELIDAGVVEKNEQRRMLTYKANGGCIRVKTAYDADTLRGDYADFLVLDECALLAPDAWDKVGAPMLLDNDGDAWFISTPRRRNWFHTLFQRAESDTTGRWAAFHFTSFDNPHLSKAALEEVASDLSAEAYRQEIMAEFLEGEGSVFRNIVENLTANAHTDPSEHLDHRMVMGVDWAQKNDFTCLCVVCADCRCEVALERFNQIDWALQRGRLTALVEKWNVFYVQAEENSIGSPNIEALQIEGLPIYPFMTTAASKPPLIQSLALAFERRECQWLEHSAATAELHAFESRIASNTHRVSYAAPEGLHDDTIIARALAWRAALAAMRGWEHSG